MTESKPETMPLPPLITLEEHFFSAAHLTSASSSSDSYSEQLKHIPGLIDKLKDLDSLRLTSMDASGIAMQIVSHGPTQPTMTAEVARAANLQLHAATVKHPRRFAGFAALPMADPDAAAKELAFCVEELGFVGALVDSHLPDGTTFEAARYSGFWYTVQSLGVPVYIHPTWATDPQRSALFECEGVGEGRVSGGFVNSVAASGWGWHSEVAVHFFKLFASGLFDKYPRLKIVLGHFGEMIPYMLGRICQLSVRWGERKRDFRTVWRENVWVTTSGVWDLTPLKAMLAEDNTPLERVVFSVDYPFAKNEDGKKWMEELRESGLVDEKGLSMIAFENAEKLLGIRLRRKEEDEEADQENETDEKMAENK